MPCGPLLCLSGSILERKSLFPQEITVDARRIIGAPFHLARPRRFPASAGPVADVIRIEAVVALQVFGITIFPIPVLGIHAFQRQPRPVIRLLVGNADAHPEYGIDERRQSEQLRHLPHVVADSANVHDAESQRLGCRRRVLSRKRGIDRRHKEILRRRVEASSMHGDRFSEAAEIGAPDEEDRRFPDMALAAGDIGDLIPQLGISYPDDAVSLHMAGRRSLTGASQNRVQLFARDRLVFVAPDGAVVHEQLDSLVAIAGLHDASLLSGTKNLLSIIRDRRPGCQQPSKPSGLSGIRHSDCRLAIIRSKYRSICSISVPSIPSYSLYISFCLVLLTCSSSCLPFASISSSTTLRSCSPRSLEI
ncbi:hypothetical protein BN871_AC_00360 [Paenibacillus sp. P22]|nr:hypothetical protein BN871_AC_00360 [Paenibacillus sp. P22]